MERNFNHQAAKFEEGDKYYYFPASHKIQGIAMKTAESEDGVVEAVIKKAKEVKLLPE